jgi:hypothetical protein
MTFLKSQHQNGIPLVANTKARHAERAITDRQLEL